MRRITIYPEVFAYQETSRVGVRAVLDNYNAFLQVLCDKFLSEDEDVTYKRPIVEDTLTYWFQYRAWRTYMLGHHTIPSMLEAKAFHTCLGS